MSTIVEVVFVLILATSATVYSNKLRGLRRSESFDSNTRGLSMSDEETKHTAIEAVLEEYEEKIKAPYSFGIMDQNVQVEQGGDYTEYLIEAYIGETHCARNIYDYVDRSKCILTGKNRKYCIFRLTIRLDEITTTDDCEDLF